LSVRASIVGEEKDRRARVVLQNESEDDLSGVEVSFSHPGDVDVELLQQAARLKSLKAGEQKVVSLGIRLGNQTPPAIPLNLVVEADEFVEDLIDWPLHLAEDGTELIVKAPIIGAVGTATVAPVGTYAFPVSVSDEKSVNYVVVYANGIKVAWLPGGEEGVVDAVDLELTPGMNRIVIVAQDNDGLIRRRSFRIWGEEAASVDAASPQVP
jgi:hypothetical protein